MQVIDPKLKEFATPREREWIDLINEHGSQRAASKALGGNKEAAGKAIRRLKVRAAKMGYSPEHDMVHTVPDGFRVKGVSTLYDSKGQVAAQWLKSTVDLDRQRELMEAAIAALSDEVRGLAPITKAPKHAMKDILAVYPFGDPHFGL